MEAPVSQQVESLKGALDQYGDKIYQTRLTINALVAGIGALTQEIEQMRAEMLQTIINARFELNNQLKYTNDHQRTAALRLAEGLNVPYQAKITSLRTKVQSKGDYDALIEMNRGNHATLLLKLKYLSGLPAEPAPTAKNYALSSEGATITGSPQINPSFRLTDVIDGTRVSAGGNWGGGGIFHSAGLPASFEIDLHKVLNDYALKVHRFEED